MLTMIARSGKRSRSATSSSMSEASRRLVELRDGRPIEGRVPLEMGSAKRFRQARHGRRSVPRCENASRPANPRYPAEVPGAGLEPARPQWGHPLLRRARLTRSATPAARVYDLDGL